MDNRLQYERYPVNLVCLSTLLTLTSYLLGTLIFYLIDIYLGLAFLALCVITVAVVLRYRCSYCYYYGKRCSTGFGLIASKLFRKRDAGDFSSPKNLMPAMLVAMAVILLPLVGGVLLVITDGTIIAWSLLAANLLLFVPAFYKKSTFCSHCKQRELGCPACDGMKGTKQMVDGKNFRNDYR